MSLDKEISEYTAKTSRSRALHEEAPVADALGRDQHPLGVHPGEDVAEPLARLAAAPRSAGDTLRAFAMLWRDLPAVLRTG